MRIDLKNPLRHILIVGQNGVGKSTLIRALLDAIPLPVYGVITKKEPPQRDGFCPVYIHLYGEERRYATGNCIGRCREGGSIAYPQAFDCFTERMQFPSDGVIVFDELGFLESDARRFTGSVLHTLDTAPFCICAVRDKQTAFLDAVRSHPRADAFSITAENRDALRSMLLSTLRERLRY
jgi:nucleoside-triphosphatase